MSLSRIYLFSRFNKREEDFENIEDYDRYLETIEGISKYVGIT